MAEISGTTHLKRKARILAAVGLLCVLAGPVSYFPLMDVPVFRNTGLSVWLMGVLGALIAWTAARRYRGRGVRSVAVICTLLPLVFVGMFFGLAKLPKPDETKLASLAEAPDFTLPNQAGQPVALSDLQKSSAVLLVFYRGHW